MKELLKHKKILIGGGIAVGVILVFVILIFTLFAVNSIEVNFLNVPQVAFVSEESAQNIINTSGIQKGKTILSVNKEQAIKNLEKENPYLKVVNIETVFPNKIVIHCAEREALFAVRSGSKYFMCDGEFKVLNVVELDVLQESYPNTQKNAIEFLGLDGNIDNLSRLNAGDFIEFETDGEMLKNITTALIYNNKTVAEQKALIKTIKFDSSIYYYTGKNQPFLQITDFNDFVTNIYVPESKLVNKFQAMFLTVSDVLYNPEKLFDEDELLSLADDYYKSYILKIEEDLQGKLNVRLEKQK